MKKRYDIVMLGHISRDIMIYEGSEQRFTAGPVIYSSAAAFKTGASVLVITKANPDDAASLDDTMQTGIDVEIIPSDLTTSIENIYLSKDRERRKVTLLAQAEPFRLMELPDFEARIIHMAGLFRGEIPEALIPPLSVHGDIAVDAQGLLRCNEGGKLLFKDWDKKKTYLPRIKYLKTDAAEAEILTGAADRERAAMMLTDAGVKEVMVTHNEEVIVGSRGSLYRAPFDPVNLSGRTGRGDTCFAAYLARRLTHDIQDSVDWAAALVSIKMESPGPFKGEASEVLLRMRSGK